jgi:hypothetical protein
MADCSELAKQIVQLAMNLAAEGTVQVKGRPFKVDTFDDVVIAMQEFIPEIRRQSLSDYFLEVTESRKKTTDAMRKKLAEIRRTPAIEKATQAKIDELNEFLETGEVPVKKKKKIRQSTVLAQMRKTRDTLRKWIETGDPVQREKLNEKLDTLNKQIESGQVDASAKTGKFHDEIQTLRDEIKSARKQIKALREEDALKDTIETLQTHLKEGTLPAKKKKAVPEYTAATELRSIISDLRKQLNRSEPARRARIEKSIADLEKRLKSGDIMPKVKPDPVRSEAIDRLVFKRDLIRKEIQDEINSMKPLTPLGKFGAAWDLVRLLMTSGEFSFGLRQGGMYFVSHPLKWGKAMGAAFKSFMNPEALFKINKEIFGRDNAPLYARAGLPLLHEGMSLTKSEEVIMNYWMDKLPIARNFNRAAIGFFNTLRADLFDMGYESIGKRREMTQGEADVWANYVSVMSGRGRLGSVEGAALAMNRAFFSARYVASRFQLLTLQPIWHQAKGDAKASAAVRIMVAKEYARVAAGLMAIFAAGWAVGADEELDPRSPNFGKLRFGNRRLDVLMGTGQVIRFLSQMITGKTKTGRGDIVPLRGDDVPYGGQTISDVMFRFGRSKLSPQFGVWMNLVTGENYTGEEINLISQAANLAYPMTYGDIYDVWQEEGMATNAILSGLTFLGMGLQTYDVNARRNQPQQQQGIY